MACRAHDLQHLVNQLKHSLEEAGYETTHVAALDHSVTINVWLPAGSCPIEAVTLTNTEEFQDFSWGDGYKHEMPLDAPMPEVANAVLAMLQEKQSVPAS
ncbi:hypothetical protein ACFWNT_11040 [Streptomyces sp. NPDC058409]|uniref:hypothetical protein n=1 Tax=Streptomyces sp. NPDC058409 TaxID=3346484 RepID=UPI00364AD1E3